MDQPIINLILFPFISLIVLFLLIISIKKKKKKWLIIMLSFFLVWGAVASGIMINQFIENYFYPYAEITQKNQKYYRDGKLLTGVSSYVNKKDSVNLKMKDGVVVYREIFLSLDTQIKISEYFFPDNGERYSRYIDKNGESISEGKFWSMLIKSSNRNLDDFILLYGKPNKIEKENNRTFYGFLIEKNQVSALTKEIL